MKRTLAMIAFVSVLPISPTAAQGFHALTGDEAANFSVPGDMELVKTLGLAVYGLTYERYQQYFGPARA